MRGLIQIKSPFTLRVGLIPAFALLSASALASGFMKANSLIQKVATGLHGLAAVTITVAVVWIGYKILWNGESIRDCKNIIIGSIFIISGSEIAALFMS